MNTTRKRLLGWGVTAAVSAALGYGAALYRPLPASVAAGPATAHRGVPDAVGLGEIYTCSMHPDVLHDKPGDCPICGMTLIKTAAEARDPAHDQVHIDEATRMRMGVRTEVASLTQMHHTASTYASINADESRSIVVTPKFDGWIRRLHVQGVGQAIKKGQVLFEIYSPELQQRQRDYIDLLTRRDALTGAGMEIGGPSGTMLGSLARERFRARDRLLAADVPPEVIQVLDKQRRIFDVVPVRASQDGIVTGVSAREGNAVNPMQPILTYADYRRVWAEVTVFPDQLNWIRNGDDIVLTSSFQKTKQLRTKVDLSTLQIDPVTRTAKLKIALANDGQAFLPGAFADVEIHSQARRALAVPRDALIRTGHGDFVVISEADGRFHTVEVKPGLEDHEMVEVLDGLRAGTRVATNGQFLLDSASSIQSMQRRQTAEDATVSRQEPQAGGSDKEIAAVQHRHHSGEM